MKRSDFFIRLTTAVLFLAVLSYVGVYVYNSMINTYVTAPVFSYSVEESFPAQGYIVRTETVLTQSGDTVLPSVGEGEKVASGQAIAVEYTSRTALETAGELRTLKLRIAQLEAPAGDSGAICYDSVTALSAAVQRGDLSKLDELSLGIDTYIFTGGPASQDDLPALQSRLELLESQSTGLNTIYAPVSGIFSQTIDGFERVKPSALTGLLPSGLQQLFSAPSSGGGVGKLVTEFHWYYAAIMDAGDAAQLTVGRQIPVRFSGTYRAQEDMLVESIGKKENGQCVVLFSDDRDVSDIAPLRFMRSDVVLGVISGLCVPKEAIHLDDDGTAFIFLESGVRAERVNVDILTETGDSYVVQDGAVAGTPLRDGSTIIVKANGLYDGKIVAKS